MLQRRWGLYPAILLTIAVMGCSQDEQPTEPGESPPTVSLILPDGAEVLDTTVVTVNATDDKGVVKVEIFIDNQIPTGGTLITAPYLFVWDATSLPDSSTHIIYAKGYDADDNVSSSPVSTVLVYRFKPSGLTGTVVADTNVTLVWTDNSTRETGFEVEQSMNNGPYVVVQTLSPNDTSAVVSFGSTRASVAFRVRAVSGSKRSGFSNEIEVMLGLTIGPPQNLRAVSQSRSSVTLHWDPAIGADAPTFLGYVVAIGGVEYSIPKTQLGYLAESLPAGPALFTVQSYQSSGPRSETAIIAWAPADRFEINAIVTEYFNQVPTRLSSFSIGSQNRDPMALPVTLSDTNVTRGMDFLLHGSNGVVEFPLSLWSAHLFQVGLRHTKFSTVSDSAANLDFPRSTFPDASTFVRDSVVLSHNRIHYVLVEGDTPGEFLFSRIHVTITPGRVFPNREIIINVSLQRVPGLPFAFTPNLPFDPKAGDGIHASRHLGEPDAKCQLRS